MFFVREQRVKIIGVLLFLNVSWTSGELPVSSYLPPNRDDQGGKFSSTSSFGGNSGESRNPPSNTYGPPNNDNLSNNRVQSSIRGNNNANNFNRGGPVRNQQIPAGNGYSYQQPRPPFKDPNTSGPGGPSAVENYQSPGSSSQQGSFGPIGNSQGGQNYQSSPANSQQSSFGPVAASYGGQNYQSTGPQQSSFGSAAASYGGPNYQSTGPQQSSFGSAAASYGGQNYQSTGPANSQQPNSFGTSAQVGQNYPSVGSTNSVPGISGTSFNTLAPSPSPTYGLPVNTSGGFEGGWGNVPFSSSNLPERKPPGLSPITLPNSYTPLSNNPIPNAGNSQGYSSNNQIPNAGNSQGYSSNLPSLSNSYGPPSVSGNSFGNTPSFGGNFNPGSNSFGSSSTPLNSNVNQFPSSGSPNVPNIQSAINPGPTGTPQTLYGAPTPNNPNAFPNNANLPNRRPSGNFGGNGSPQTLYSPPISSVQTPADSYSPQGNQNRGSIRPPSPTYGPPLNSLPFETNSQSFRPEEFEKLSQNTRPFDNFNAGYQNSTSNLPNPPSQLYGAPISNTPNAGYNQGPTQNDPYPPSSSQFSSVSSLNPNINSAPNQGRPSPSPIPSIPNSPQPGYPQRLQNQPPSPSPTYGSPVNQVNRTYTPSNTYQPPLQSFTNENTPQSSYLPPFSTFSSPSGSGSGTVGGYETSKSPNSIPSGLTFGTTGGSYEAPRSPNQIQSGSEFGSYEVPKLPTNGIPFDSGFGTSGGGYEASRSPSLLPSRSQSPVNSLPPLYSTLSTNSLDQGLSQNQQGYPGSQGSKFGNPLPTEVSRPSSFTSPSSNYGPPTRDYTDALLGDYNPTSPEQGNTFFSNTNSFGEIYSTDRNTQQSPNPTFDQGTPAQSAYSGFSPNPSSIGESPEGYGAPKPTNDFTNEQNSPAFTNLGSTDTNSGTQPELNFGTNSASSYLPPNQSNNEDVVPSTSYTLPSEQPNSSQPGTSNAPKNTHRNVGSDLITGASTSPFLPFKDDVSKPNVAPSRATYEKAQEITSNSLAPSGYDTAKPAKYQFNYDVKGFGPEFSHQESRNGSTTSGSYGVVLPDGRKQVVDYEANQEGFYPKIRYEETPNNSLQQNNDRNQGYNYSPNTPSVQNLSQSTPNVDSFNQGSSLSYPETQSSYQRPDYTGTVANQGSYSSPYNTPSSQLGYPINNQATTSNFNGYN